MKFLTQYQRERLKSDPLDMIMSEFVVPITSSAAMIGLAIIVMTVAIKLAFGFTLVIVQHQ